MCFAGTRIGPKQNLRAKENKGGVFCNLRLWHVFSMLALVNSDWNHLDQGFSRWQVGSDNWETRYCFLLQIILNPLLDSDLQIKNEPKNTTTAVVCDDKSNCHLVKNKDVIVSLIAVVQHSTIMIRFK